MAVFDLPKVTHPDFSTPGTRPTGQVEIDWDNPLSLALSVVVLGHSPVNLVNGRPAFAKSGVKQRAEYTDLNSLGAYVAHDVGELDTFRGFSMGAIAWPQSRNTDNGTNCRLFGLSDKSDADRRAVLSSAPLLRYNPNNGTGSNLTLDAAEPSNGVPFRGVVVERMEAGRNIYARSPSLVSNVSSGTSLISSTMSGLDTFCVGGWYKTSGDVTHNGQWLSDWAISCLWNRQLTQAESDAWMRDPYQILRPLRGSRQFIFATGGGTVTLVVNGVTQSQSLDGVTLTQAHQLGVAGIEQGQLLGTAALVQANVIAPAGIGQAQALDNVALTQAHIIAINDIDQSQTIGGVTLAQAGSIAPTGITQAQLIDAVTLTQANILSVANIEQAQSLHSVTLTVAGSLAIQSVLQGQTIDATALTQAHTISVDGLTQGQAIDAAALVQHYQLAVQSLIQGQTLGNVTLSAAGLVLEVDGMAQGQTVAAAGLTEHAVLSVNNLTQSQIIDIVNLGGLVIGSLNGTLVMYAKLGGNVVSYTLLDGTVQTVH